MNQSFHATTILAVRRKNNVVMVGDGQVSLGNTVMKQNAVKIRRAYNNQVLVGFAGSTADAFYLFEKFETKLEEFAGNLSKASVELAKEWRTNKIFRHLEAMLLTANKDNSYILSGRGDVIEPEDKIMAIGSGGQFALSAAKALIDKTDLSAKEIAIHAMKIASEICVFTNSHFTIEEIN
ncbi:MAG: ATP-dependent protease subunit HslV [SAR324 cluster bacterium]|nr:ATP-dependent protease subunit HslV [SAR324 cluster bacterium]